MKVVSFGVAEVGRLWVDVLVWDTEDERHQIRGGDDLAKVLPLAA